MKSRLYTVIRGGEVDTGWAHVKALPIQPWPLCGRIADWQPLDMEMRDGGAVYDYLPNDEGLRLCSKRLMEILKNNSGEDDEIQWLPVRVHDGGVVRIFHIMHFVALKDAVDVKHSLRADNGVVLWPAFYWDRLGDGRVFDYEGTSGVSLYVTGDVKKKLEEAGILGMEFEEVRASWREPNRRGKPKRGEAETGAETGT